MELAEQFVATARRLFETVPGSAAQRSANQWLVGFQASADAWRVALLVLQRTTQRRDQPVATAWQLPPTVLVVTMQLLRFKITNAWSEINEEQRGVVKQTVLAWLREGDANSASAPAVRVACVIAATLVAKMYAREWPLWHQELQQHLHGEHSPGRIVQLLEIYGAIPAQLQVAVTDASEAAQLSGAFSSHVVEIARMAREAIAIGGSVRDCALRCIEHWGVGCISTAPELGIDVALLAQSSLLRVLLELGFSGEEQAATEIVTDVFMSTLSDPLFLSPRIVDATVHTVSYLLSTKRALVTQVPNDSDSRWQSMSQIASSIAMHHAVAVFSPEAQEVYTKMPSPPSDRTPSFALDFLELMLACTSYPDANVAQPTLEFWFFFLDSSVHRGVQLRLLSTAVSPDQLIGVLGRLVNALIERCRYPQRLVEAQTLPSATHDDEEVETITSLRKEIADTILSIFSKWPTGPTTERGASCVKGMAALLHSSTDIATLEAVLFLLEYTIELFDIDSSGSEDEELEDDDAGLALQSSHEGAQLLQHILLDALKLPSHPLILSGVTRFYQSLAKSLVLPGTVYVLVARKLSQGLDMEVLCSVSAHALLSLSKSIIQYTDIEERRELLELLATKCRDLCSPLQAGGDLLEAAFRLTQSLSESDFTAFCNAVLTPLTERVTSSDTQVAAAGVLLLGRAIGGCENPALSRTLSDEVWPLVEKATISHSGSPNFRESAIQFFSSAIVKNPAASMDRLHQVVTYCTQWLPHSASAATLQCLSTIVSNEVSHDAKFFPVVNNIVEVTMTVITQRVNFDPSLDDDTNRKQVDWVFSHEQTTDHLTPEVTELFALLRLVLRFFPSSLAPEPVLTTLLRVCWLLLDVDHQVQEICDSVCDFVLDVCSSSSLLSCSPTVSDTLVAASPHLLRAVLAFFGPKRTHYKPRNLWHFLFQLLHAPRIVPALKAPFQTALSRLLIAEHVLSPPLSIDQSQSLADALSRTTHRHRFVALLAQTAKQVEAMTTH